MNQKNIEKLIPIALIELNNSTPDYKLVNPDDSIDSTYYSYIDSFGISVRMSGLITTLTFYKPLNDEDERKKKHSRVKIYNLFARVLKKGDLLKDWNGDFLQYVIANKEDTIKKLYIRNRIIETAAACKLAIKTFKKNIVEEE